MRLKVHCCAIVMTSLLSGCKDNGTSPVVPPPTPENFFQATVCPTAIVRSLALGSHGYMFAETPQGILSSADSGASWQWSFTQSTEGYVAAGADGHVYASAVTGVYFSSDNGSTWGYTQTGLSDSTDAVNPAPLAVASNGLVFLGTLASGVYRSTDNGVSWSPTSMPHRDVRSLYITPNGEIIAGCNYYQTVIFKSTDQGATWIEGPSISNQVIYALASDSLANLYAGGIRYLYRSTDLGYTWTTIASTSSRITSIAAMSQLQIFAAVVGGGVFRSNDGGTTWVQVNSGLPHPNGRCLVLDSRGFLFVGTDGDGIFRSVRQTTD